MVRAFRWRGTFNQPFAIPLFGNIWNAHARLTNKTIMVEDNNIDKAFHLLNR